MYHISNVKKDNPTQQKELSQIPFFIPLFLLKEKVVILVLSLKKKLFLHSFHHDMLLFYIPYYEYNNITLHTRCIH